MNLVGGEGLTLEPQLTEFKSLYKWKFSVGRQMCPMPEDNLLSIGVRVY
jgi:hypothetical protein